MLTLLLLLLLVLPVTCERQANTLQGQSVNLFGAAAVDYKIGDPVKSGWLLAECDVAPAGSNSAPTFKTSVCPFITGLSACGGVFEETYSPLDPTRFCGNECRVDIDRLFVYRATVPDVPYVSQINVVKGIVDVILDLYTDRCRMGSVK